MARSLPSTTDDVFMSVLSPKDLVSFARSCHAHRDRVKAYTCRAFNVEKLLKNYFTTLEVHYFRYLQSRTQMFISGSTALQFFERIEYPNSDLDIYVEHRYRETVVEWLLHIGYEFKSRGDTSLEEELKFTFPGFVTQTTALFESTSAGYFGRGVANVYNFYKYYPERKIQLITCHHAPLEVVLNFHSTCVMNLITHDKAYALYPKATFEERQSLVYSTEGVKQDSARKKYVTRGWTMVEHLSPAEVNSDRTAFKSGLRHVGDSLSWTIDLFPEMRLSESFIRTNTWTLCFDPEGGPLMKFEILLFKKLAFSYLIGDRDVYSYLRPSLFLNAMPGKLDADISLLLQWKRRYQ
ncbi:hypothetical protein CPB83DRAFT_864681 [Crepidotus variabilis]|uniref:Uncharacterized protein n=1 Tax=Crepidotus variabilis TaxID=179855 RepID=A0A9P6E4E9_9AGAR|nr:hypothetical protein CPB83DRAFT_864681 [Crepidotus variabilis]